MQLSRKADYGLRLVFELAKVYPNGRVATHEIAKRQAVPEPFLAKIVAELARSGLVVSKRGSGGGIFLARPPEEITLLDVIEALDGPIAFAPCRDNPYLCCWAGQCVLEDVLKGATEAVERYLRNVTFADIVAEDRRRRRVVLVETPEHSQSS